MKALGDENLEVYHQKPLPELCNLEVLEPFLLSINKQ